MSIKLYWVELHTVKKVSLLPAKKQGDDNLNNLLVIREAIIKFIDTKHRGSNPSIAV